MRARNILWLLALMCALSLVLACSEDSEDGDEDCWTDPNTGFTWQIQPADGLMTWQQAVEYCDQLELGGHEDWMLANIDELRSIIRGCPETETLGECGMVDGCLECWTDVCEACEENYQGVMDNCRFPSNLLGGCEEMYWSSSEHENDSDVAAWADFFGASLGSTDKTFEFQARCVRH